MEVVNPTMAAVGMAAATNRAAEAVEAAGRCSTTNPPHGATSDDEFKGSFDIQQPATKMTIIIRLPRQEG